MFKTLFKEGGKKGAGSLEFGASTRLMKKERGRKHRRMKI